LKSCLIIQRQYERESDQRPTPFTCCRSTVSG
jgi:hypothetical protein